MACEYNLTSLLTGTFDEVGTWELTSAPSSPSSFIIDGVVNNSVNVGDPIGTTFDPVVDFGPTAPGVYVFTYSIDNGTVANPCVASTPVTVTVNEGVYAGEGGPIQRCEIDDTDYVLGRILEGQVPANWPVSAAAGSNGTVTVVPGSSDPADSPWTGSGTNSAGFTLNTTNFLDSTFNPSLHSSSTFPVVLEFTYSVQVAGADQVGCTNCADTHTIV